MDRRRFLGISGIAGAGIAAGIGIRNVLRDEDAELDKIIYDSRNAIGAYRWKLINIQSHLRLLREKKAQERRDRENERIS